MILLDYIKEHADTWRKDIADMGIKIKDYKNYTLFHYDMIKCDFAQALPNVCRGIILADAGTSEMQIVCRPFDKFFNIDETYAAKIDWDSARIESKRDGSIMKVWYAPKEKKWMLSTATVIDADECYINNTFGHSFGDMFRRALLQNYGITFDGLCEHLDVEYTYIFELCTPENVVVVDYGSAYVIWHIGTRHTLTGKEKIVHIGIDHPQVFDISGEKNVRLAAAALNKDKFEHEGFVVVDKNWNRVKIKTIEYVQRHHLRGNGVISIKKINDIINNHEESEYLAYFPNQKEYFDRYYESVDMVLFDIKYYCSLFSEYKQKYTKLTANLVALVEQRVPKEYRHYVYNYIKSGASAEEMWGHIPTKTRLQLINKRWLGDNND